jgi:tetratricopeptide (TPR) repeat protein
VDTTDTPPLQISQIELLELVAYLHLRYGDPARALSYLKLLERLLPENPRIMRSLAIAHLRTANPDEASSHASKALSLEDSDRGKTASQLVMGLASTALAGETQSSSEACDEFCRMRALLTTP